MFVDFNILNQLGSPSINSNTFANRPAAGQTGRLFVSTDTFEIYRDNGTGWDLIGGPGAGTITGTGTATQVAYFTGSQTIGSSANLFWDNTAGALGINTATPGAELDIHGTGTIVQVNATGATSNAYLAFQRTGTGVWRIGDTYNGGSNFFELHNTVLTIDALEFEAATNKSTFLGQQTYASGLATGNQFTYNLTVPNGVNITSPNAVGAVNSYLNLSLGGNTTVPAGARQGLEGNSRISFTGAGTLTMTQGSTVRAFSALSSVYSFNGSAIGTITHLAGLRICFPDNIGSAINITNNYGLLLNNQTAGLGTVTYTNRWGIYQEGASDLNYFNGNLLVKTTTNAGFALDINGTARVQGNFNVSGAAAVTTISPNTITGATDFFVVSTASLGTYITCRENGTMNLGPTSGQRSIGFSNTTHQATKGSVYTFNQGGAYVPVNQLNTAGFYIQANYSNSGAGGTSEGALFQFEGGTNTTIGNVTFNQISMKPTYNNTAGTTTNRGLFYNPTLTSLTGTTHRAIETVSGDVILGSTSGSTGIGATTTINASAILQVTSTTQGFLPPRMTTAQKNAIAAPAAGLTIYDTTLNKLCVFTGVNWETVTSV